ncbi:unnamed protein product [Mytilus coruscus]|uniref:Uncharacterized protein n=1 Tax=Mytilus coruscus TaxID=42192 RepID=A0A6J8CZZ8_MYTCO|nr:unnamed protein product [Mytilus coruscus]
MALGFLCNAAAIITLCVVNQNVYITGNATKGLFITIVIFTVLSFLIMKCIAFPLDLDDKCSLTFLIGHRIYEIEYDIVVCVYSLLLSNWEMAKLAIVITVLAIIDITASAISLIKNSYDLKKQETHIWELLIPICVFIFVPFPALCIIAMLCSGSTTNNFSSSGGSFGGV